MANSYLTNIHTRKIIPENGDFSQSVHVKICIIKKKHVQMRMKLRRVRRAK